MKFYSEELKALFDSAEELEQAEVEHKAKTESKARAMNELIQRFEDCIKEINSITEDIAKVSENLSPSEERKLIRKFMDSITNLSLPLFWQF